jgi:hypothetical protein
MVDKVHGLVPEAGSWTEGELTYVYKAAASLLAADTEELQQFGTIVILANDTTNTMAALSYAADPVSIAAAGWTVGDFAVV